MALFRKKRDLSEYDKNLPVPVSETSVVLIRARQEFVLAMVKVGKFTKKRFEHFWETKGGPWWETSKIFMSDAYKAVVKDAFGYDVGEPSRVYYGLALPPGESEIDKLY